MYVYAYICVYIQIYIGIYAQCRRAHLHRACGSPACVSCVRVCTQTHAPNTHAYASTCAFAQTRMTRTVTGVPDPGPGGGQRVDQHLSQRFGLCPPGPGPSGSWRRLRSASARLMPASRRTRCAALRGPTEHMRPSHGTAGECTKLARGTHASKRRSRTRCRTHPPAALRRHRAPLFPLFFVGNLES